MAVNCRDKAGCIHLADHTVTLAGEQATSPLFSFLFFFFFKFLEAKLGDGIFYLNLCLTFFSVLFF